MLITDALIQASAKSSTNPAIRFQGKDTTYAQLRQTIGRLSYLYQNEIGHDQRVAFLCSNSPAVIATFFALTNLRTRSLFLNPNMAADDLGKILKDFEATHIAVTSDLTTQVRQTLSNLYLNLPLIEIEKKRGGEYDTTYTPPSDKVPKETDIVLVLKTGGITGKPKLVAVNHKEVQSAATCLRKPYHSGGADRFFTTLHWSSPFAFTHSVLYPLMTGASVIVDLGLQAVELLDFMLENRVTRLIETPKFLFKLLVTMKTADRMSLPGLRSITVGLGQLSAAIRKTFDLLKIPTAHCYGQTENIWTIAMEDTQEVAPPENGYSMTPLAGFQYKVVDEQGDVVEGDSRIGRLAVQGPCVMEKYEGPESRKEEIEKETKGVKRGTWLYTGDLAELKGESEELRIHYWGRHEDMLPIEGGYQRPDPIDLALKGMPGVVDAAGFVMKNATGKKILAVAVIKAPKANVTDQQIKDKCAATVMGGGLPAAVFFTDEIPHDDYGNPHRVRLRQQFSGVMV